MTNQPNPPIGAIVWQDLTVANAAAIQAFYCDVIGWESNPHPITDYHDFDIIVPATGETAAGICHARDSNANLPPQWLITIAVDDVDHSAQRCLDLGGRIVDGPRAMGASRFCVIQDRPAPSSL